MHALRIHRFHARYRLPGRRAGERRRLDGILGSALGEALDTALAGFPLAPREELCIRHLHVPVRLRLDRSDLALAAVWGEALASAIRSAPTVSGPRSTTAGAPAIEVVRYPSREHALIEIAAQAVHGDRRRAWAWRQLDLWRTGDAVSDAEAVREWVRTLVREPGLIVPILRWLAGTHRLETLALRLEGSHWLSLAAAALEFNGLPLTWKDLTGAAASRPADEPVAVSPSPATNPTDPIATRILRDSRIANAVPIHRVASPGESGWAALAVLEADPGWVARPPEAWARLLRRMTARPGGGPHPVSAKDRPAPAGTMPARPEPSSGWDRTAPNPGRPADPSAAPKHRADASTPQPKNADQPVDPRAEDPRRRGHTRFGGLLFLLNLLPAVGIPGRLEEEFPALGIREVLYRLGLRLVAELGFEGGEIREDPAVLAFAGLSPGTPWPEEETLEASDTARLETLASEVTAELERHLPPAASGSEPVLKTVCLRTAEIVADPGWIEVRFRMRDVSTDLRRVGLDLDPGYLPWLGVVMRFVYE
ncbi:MAG: hypothetical protein KF833_04345 [Verrucomicrobiae bacterium]|nr:hypothetical protein [Verrucomicrobiae bacterium]